MKKSMIAALLLMCLLMALCVACGGSGKDNQTQNENEQAQTELPTVTPKPAGENSGQNMIAAEENEAATLDGVGGVTYVSEAHEIAAGLVGQDVQALYDAIGEPNSFEYAVGCYENGDDGYLYYDGFYVTTYRYDNGAETIMGAFAN